MISVWTDRSRRRTTLGVVLTLCASIVGAADAEVTLAEFREHFREGSHRLALAEGEELLSEGVGPEAAILTLMAAAWLEESRAGLTVASLLERSLRSYYPLTIGRLDPEARKDVDLYTSLAILAAGDAQDAASRLAALEADVRLGTVASAWRSVAEALPDPASRDAAIAALDSTAPVEAALARLAYGHVDDVPEVSADAFTVGDPRHARIAALHRWAQSERRLGSEDAFPIAFLQSPIAFAGRAAARDIPLVDVFVLLAYAHLAAREAERTLPDAPPGGAGSAFYEEIRGEIAWQRAAYDEAAVAFGARSADLTPGDATAVTDEGSLAALARARARGEDVMQVVRRAAMSDHPGPAGDCVRALSHEPDVPWRDVAELIEPSVSRWEGALADDAERSDLLALRWARWATGFAWLRAGEPERAGRYIDASYDPGHHGNLRVNPPEWLSGYVSRMERDVNNQTIVLRAIGATARHIPMFWLVYDVVQREFVHRFPDSPSSIRR